MSDGTRPQQPVVIRLLGPLDVLVDGTEAAVGGPRPRALLSLLALTPGTAVTTPRLVDILWDGEPAASAANAVQVYVSRLRRALTPAGGGSPLRAAGGGYLLDLPDEAVDVRRFERLAAAGHEQLARAGADPAALERAAATLGEGLALWRGPALTELAGLSAADGLIARLEGRRLSALHDRLDAEAALGRYPQIVPELEELVRSHPLDEQLVGRLMTALYHSGRQADALAAYTEAGSRLADELGVDPGPALRELYTGILRQDLARPVVRPAPAEPPAPPNDPPIDPPAEPPVAQVPSTVPPVTAWRAAFARPRTALVGRTEELRQALELVADPQVRLVTLLGPGGTGKTRLSLEVASRVEALVVQLATVLDPVEVLPEIVRALGGSPQFATEPLLDVAARALLETGPRPPLLVLDNLEQLVREDGPIPGLAELLDAVPSLTLLATSRSSLRLAGEHVLALAPLPLPALNRAADPRTVREEALGSDAVRLFRDRARAVLPGFDVTEANAAAVAEICRTLDGLPLALELAAARVRTLPPAQMLTRIGNRLKLLTGGPRDIPDRHRSMRAALDWSVHLLDPAQRRLFAQLSVFVGGWTLEAAEAICRPDQPGEGAEDLLDLLDRLVDQSLVVSDGSGRMALLQIVREHAAEQLAGGAALDEEAVHATRRRHAEYHAELAERLGWGWRNASPEGKAELDVEAANMAVALQFAESDGDGALLGRLVAGLVDYWFFSGRLTQARRWFAVASDADVPPSIRARLLMAAGNISLVQGDLKRAVEDFRAAHDEAVKLGDDLFQSRSLGGMSIAYRYLGQFEQALASQEGAIAAAERSGLHRRLPELSNERAEVLFELGRVEEAIPAFERLREWATLEDEPDDLPYALVNLAFVAEEQGDPARARRLIAAAERAAEASDSVPDRAQALASVGVLTLRVNGAAHAAALLRTAAELTHASGQLLRLPELVCLYGAALQALDQPVAAARLLGAGTAWLAERSMVPGRLTRRVIAEAEQALATAGPAEAVTAARAAGAQTPFGSLTELLGALELALSLPDAVKLVPISRRP